MFTLALVALVTLAVLQVAPGAGTQPGITEPLEAGSRLLRAGELESARIRFQEVIRLCPTCVEGYALVALTDMSAGRYAAAVEGYKRALQLQPDDPALHEQIANAYLQLGEWQEARVGFQRTLHRVPRSPQSVYGLAIIAFVEARYDESVALLEQALRLAPENAKIQYQLYAAY